VIALPILLLIAAAAVGARLYFDHQQAIKAAKAAHDAADAHLAAAAPIAANPSSAPAQVAYDHLAAATAQVATSAIHTTNVAQNAQTDRQRQIAVAMAALTTAQRDAIDATAKLVTPSSSSPFDYMHEQIAAKQALDDAQARQQAARAELARLGVK